MKSSVKFSYRLALGCCVLGVTILCLALGRAALDPRLPDSGAPPSLYSNQCRQDLRRTLRSAIDQAQTSVHLASYTLRDPHILGALRRAAERGVTVRVVMDRRQARGVAKQLGPDVELVKCKGRGLMHQKLVVIDEHQVWLGSANMTNASLRAYGNLIVALEQPSLARDLIQSMGDEKASRHRSYLSNGQMVDYWQLPDEGEALTELIGLIDSAERQIRIAMFTWTHAKLADAVVRAHQRGVDVRVAIDRASGHGASKKVVRQLTENGVLVKLSLGMELLHHKLAWIDDDLAIGSANWTRSAFTKNCDCFLVLHQLDGDQQRLLGKLWRVVAVEAKPISYHLAS